MKTKLTLLICVMTALPILAKANTTDLTGLWKTGCKEGLSKEQDINQRNSVTTENFFQDRFCKIQSFQFKTTGLIGFSDENVLWIDFVYTDVELTVFNEQVIADMNSRLVCGFGDWQLATPRIITGLRCALFNRTKETQISKAGDQKFGIYKLEDDRLYFGQLTRETDGSEPLKRPTSWSEEFYRK